MGADCNSINTIWHISIAIGAVPALITVYLARTFLPETPRFLVHILQPRFLGLSADNSQMAQKPPHSEVVESKVQSQGSAAPA